VWLLPFNVIFFISRHIPKAKATTVVETPEMRRLAENTKLQSQVHFNLKKKYSNLKKKHNRLFILNRFNTTPISRKLRVNLLKLLMTLKPYESKPTLRS
jgi:hypothetical protein